MLQHSPAYWLALALLGLLIGVFGTLIGTGGGFVLMPVLVLLYPTDDPALLASISLAVVFFNALSGSVGYAFQHRIDYRAGVLFSAAAAPGAVVGALITGLLPRRTFDVLLGAFLVAASLFVAISAARKAGRTGRLRDQDAGPEGGAETVPESAPTDDSASTRRSPRVAFDRPRGVGLSFAVGFVSSLLGIGGGIIHVPALVLLLRFPVHVATATSHFVLAITALAGTLVHVASNSFQHGLRRTTALGLGVVIGAQFGARLARRTHPSLIIRAISLALALVGVRIIYAALVGV